MAKRTIHVLVDDLDGGEAEETVKFSLDGISYEIDLSEKNAAKLREALQPYVAAGSKVGRGGVLAGGRSARARGGVGDRDQNKAIREWAISKGMQVSGRGRISKEIQEQYHREAGR